MTKRVLLSSIAVIAAGAAIFAVTALRKPVEAYAAEGAGKLTVTGQGSVSAKPDIAYVSVGATVQNASPTVAQSTNAEIMEKVLAAIKGLGIEEKDIQTSEYNIYPQVDYQNGNKVTGYTVTNVVRVAVRNLDITGEVLDQAVAAGANAGYGIQFSIQDSTPYYEQAMDLAIQGAISKARSVGKSLGVSVGSPVEIVESGGSYAPVNAGVMKALADESSARTSIQTGELTVTANITAVFNY
ncbi:MAG: SIMPL domain-containing protein [Clostridiales bacterium]|nr:SIMPL domain-containing protein [Clostridiales bacterium]